MLFVNELIFNLNKNSKKASVITQMPLVFFSFRLFSS